jgi:hypothetical protein
VIAAAALEGWSACGVTASPITGPAGNHEYLLWLRSGAWPAAAEQQKAAGASPDGEAIRRLVGQTLGV